MILANHSYEQKEKTIIEAKTSQITRGVKAIPPRTGRRAFEDRAGLGVGRRPLAGGQAAPGRVAEMITENEPDSIESTCLA